MPVAEGLSTLYWGGSNIKIELKSTRNRVLRFEPTIERQNCYVLRSEYKRNPQVLIPQSTYLQKRKNISKIRWARNILNQELDLRVRRTRTCFRCPCLCPIQVISNSVKLDSLEKIGLDRTENPWPLESMKSWHWFGQTLITNLGSSTVWSPDSGHPCPLSPS